MSNSNSLPVDIQYKKMLEWLIDRGLLHKAWNKSYKRLRNSIASAINKDASCDSVKHYLADHKSANAKGESDYESFTYFHAKDVLNFISHIVNPVVTTEIYPNRYLIIIMTMTCLHGTI